MKLDPTPAIELARRQLVDAGWHEREGNDLYKVDNIPRVAERCGVTPRTVCRWMSGSRINGDTADRVAINLGTHPALLWPDEWYAE